MTLMASAVPSDHIHQRCIMRAPPIPLTAASYQHIGIASSLISWICVVVQGSEIGTGACGDTYALDTVRQQWEEVTSVSTIQRAWGGLATLDNGDEVTVRHPCILMWQRN